ncbi:cobalamin-dependent protein [Nocardia thailandica]|uniref:cobalamin-dependent protein n=1 Tax=Nocardia thailandica TaxID=257275 RepID=UPI001C3F1C6E|nr:cobalamin-dependent protein [Nocardia thailandica]
MAYRHRGTVILGVAASDAHAVANQLIAHDLRERGYDVVNLGTCTPISEFAAAAEEYPDALAIFIGSLNGHIHEDLRDLSKAKQSGAIRCPVVVGGNLSVGSDKSAQSHERLFDLGVDAVLTDATEIPSFLSELVETADVQQRSAS